MSENLAVLNILIMLTSFFPEEKMKRFFEIPEQYRLICFTPLGVPDKWPETPPKKKLEEIVIFGSF